MRESDREDATRLGGIVRSKGQRDATCDAELGLDVDGPHDLRTEHGRHSLGNGEPQVQRLAPRKYTWNGYEDQVGNDGLITPG